MLLRDVIPPGWTVRHEGDEVRCESPAGHRYVIRPAIEDVITAFEAAEFNDRLGPPAALSWCPGQQTLALAE